MKLIDCSQLNGPCTKCKKQGLLLMPVGPKRAAICARCMLRNGDSTKARMKALLGGQYAGAFIWPRDGRLDHEQIVVFDLRRPADQPPGCPRCLALALFAEQQKGRQKRRAVTAEPEMKKGDEHAFAA